MDWQALLGEIESLWPLARNALTELIQPWRLVQVAILAAAFLLAHVITRALEPGFRVRLRALEGTSKARLRVFLILLHRLRPLIFIALLWATVAVMRAMTWPSRSYLIALAASLVSAWVFVAIASRLIRYRLVRAVVTWSAWGFVTLHILGIWPEAVEFLDSTALSIGEFRISLLTLMEGTLVVGLMIAVAGWASRLTQTRIEANDDMSPSMKVLADKAARLFFYGIAIVIALQSIGFDLTSLTVLSGAIGLGLGFGLQKVVSNLVSGIILLVDKSIKPGDVISLGETFGWIQTLGARYVAVVTRDGREYLIPNEDLITGQVVNWSHSSNLVRLDIYFGVSYDSDPHQVRKLAREAAAAVDRVIPEPAPVCHIVGFGDSSIDFILRFWIRDPHQGLTNVRGNVYLALWDALKEAEIEIPFPQRDITIKGGSLPAAPPEDQA